MFRVISTPSAALVPPVSGGQFSKPKRSAPLNSKQERSVSLNQSVSAPLNSKHSYMHDVTPKVVAMAVRMVITMSSILLQSFLLSIIFLSLLVAGTRCTGSLPGYFTVFPVLAVLALLVYGHICFPIPLTPTPSASYSPRFSPPSSPPLSSPSSSGSCPGWMVAMEFSSSRSAFRASA